jgi:hypothetical protein
MTKKAQAAAFLENMQRDVGSHAAGEGSSPNGEATAAVPSRNGRKHIGGYCNPDRVEKFAILRARLRLDNSELISLAIDDLYRKHAAKRAFGDT